MFENNVQERLSYLGACLKEEQLFSKSTLTGEYLLWLADLLMTSRDNPLFCDNYKPIVEANKEKSGSVFASVVMRTQGRRPEALREALLCLYAQSEQDFEVLLIGHKLKEHEKVLVEQILEEQEPEFRKKIRYLPLDYGTRTTPLNYGFAHAHGQYIMILDDDDLVFEHWMRNFREEAEKHPGTLLHSYVFSQQWEIIETDQGEAALRACKAPETKYCVDFDFVDELTENVCPLMGLAFPAKAFHSWGLIFDETLTTTEDWDYMMRVAFLSGVTDIRKPSSIYRLWTNAESSATVHSLEEWQKNYAKIQDKLKQIPLVLRKGDAFHIREVKSNKHLPVQHATPRIMDDKLYYGDDEHWSEEHSMVLEQPCMLGSFRMVYEGLADKHTCNKLRWDPVSYGNVFIRGLSAMLIDETGNTCRLTGQQIHSTGEVYHDGLLFLKEDPQVFFDIPAGFRADKLLVWGESMQDMPIAENRKSLKLTILLKKVLRRMHIVK